MLAWKQKLGVISGNALEYYDIAVFAAIMPYLSHIMQESGLHHSNYIVWGIFALRFLIRPFGAVVVGKIADSKGKKKCSSFNKHFNRCSLSNNGLLASYQTWRICSVDRTLAADGTVV